MRKCITISGGFDSGCLPFIFRDIVNEYDFVLFDYNQNYLEQEKRCAKNLAGRFKTKLIEIKMRDMIHDQERRNFLFIAKLKQLGYSEVMMGNRNIFPFHDKYKDSNLMYLQMIGFLFRIKIKLPIVGWRKNKVLTFLSKNNYFDFYNCYNTLGDFESCTCQNCLEIKRWRNGRK